MHQTIADNLANASTSGYKAYAHMHKSFGNVEVRDPNTGKSLGQIAYGSEPADTHFDFAQGALRQTGNPLDFAINGDGFFAVQDTEGNVSYTRDGHFTIDQDGFMINSSGNYVLDAGLSPIFIGLNGVDSVQVQRNGNLLVNDQYNSTLRPFVFPESAPIVRTQGNKFIPGSDDVVMTLSENFVVQQGFVESSNVSTIKTSAELVQVMRNYETNQQIMRAQSDTLEMLMEITNGI